MSRPTDTEERGLHPLRYPLAKCPACGSSHLDAVVENDSTEVHFLCGECARCWHVEFGRVHRMSPETCLGCPQRDHCRPITAAPIRAATRS